MAIDETAAKTAFKALDIIERDLDAVKAHAQRGWTESHEQEARAESAEKRIKELEAENARLRQQRDAANAQLDWLLEQPEVSNGLAAKIQES